MKIEIIRSSEQSIKDYYKRIKLLAEEEKRKADRPRKLKQYYKLQKELRFGLDKQEGG